MAPFLNHFLLVLVIERVALYHQLYLYYCGDTDTKNYVSVHGLKVGNFIHKTVAFVNNLLLILTNPKTEKSLTHLAKYYILKLTLVNLKF